MSRDFGDAAAKLAQSLAAEYQLHYASQVNLEAIINKLLSDLPLRRIEEILDDLLESVFEREDHLRHFLEKE